MKQADQCFQGRTIKQIVNPFNQFWRIALAGVAVPFPFPLKLKSLLDEKLLLGKSNACYLNIHSRLRILF